MQLNNKLRSVLTTYEGAPAKFIKPEAQLKRSVMACLLWEGTFYEDGENVYDRIRSLIPKVDPLVVKNIAIEAREKMKLRHVPLAIVREMARLPEHKKHVSETLYQIIQRPDEMAEFLSIYWKDGKEPLSAQVKKGLAKAFTKFDAYQLAKYDRKGFVRLRDVLFLTHPKPNNKEQDRIWKQLVDGMLSPPDTWEVALSAGKDKKESWERLLRENKLGALALLRNLRNMYQVDIDENLVVGALEKMRTDKILPFRFIAAAKHAPQWETYLEKSMLKCLEEHEKLSGKTIVLVDVSGSMEDYLSHRSELTRLDAANGLAIMIREICEDVSIYTFSDDVVRVPTRNGFALSDAIENSQFNWGTNPGLAINYINSKESYDRIIVITDEQSSDIIPSPLSNKAYMINVATYENGVGYGDWIHIDGWSESVVDYIIELEKEYKI